MLSTVAKTILVCACLAMLSACGTMHKRPVPLPTATAANVDPRALEGCGPALAKEGEDPVISGRRKENARRCEAEKRAILANYITGLGRIP